MIIQRWLHWHKIQNIENVIKLNSNFFSGEGIDSVDAKNAKKNFWTFLCQKTVRDRFRDFIS